MIVTLTIQVGWVKYTMLSLKYAPLTPPPQNSKLALSIIKKWPL